MLLHATPNMVGFANFVLPLQIGSPDVAGFGWTGYRLFLATAGL